MKQKEILSITLITLLIISLTACAVKPTQELSTGNYEVSLYAPPEDISILREDTAVYVLEASKELSQPAELVKSISINETEYTLNYSHSEINEYNEECYYYESSDGNITAAYLASSMRIIYLRLENQDMSKFADMDLAEYEAWIRQFVAQFSEEDWSSFQPHYATYMRVPTGGTAVPEYVTEFNDEYQLSARQFTYHSHIDDCKTSDLIRAMFDIELNRFWFQFNHHRFDTVTVDLDMNAINTAITNFTSTNLRTLYSLKSITPGIGTLLLMDGNLMYSCYVTVNYTAGGIAEESKFQVIIDIPDP